MTFCRIPGHALLLHLPHRRRNGTGYTVSAATRHTNRIWMLMRHDLPVQYLRR